MYDVSENNRDQHFSSTIPPPNTTPDHVQIAYAYRSELYAYCFIRQLQSRQMLQRRFPLSKQCGICFLQVVHRLRFVCCSQ